jgi:hypothetical protein
MAAVPARQAAGILAVDFMHVHTYEAKHQGLAVLDLPGDSGVLSVAG